MTRQNAIEAYEQYSQFHDQRIRLAQISVALANYVQIELHDKRLIGRIGNPRCKNNGEALIDWLQTQPQHIRSEPLEALAGRLIAELTDLAA